MFLERIGVQHVIARSEKRYTTSKIIGILYRRIINLFVLPDTDLEKRCPQGPTIFLPEQGHKHANTGSLVGDAIEYMYSADCPTEYLFSCLKPEKNNNN